MISIRGADFEMVCLVRRYELLRNGLSGCSEKKRIPHDDCLLAFTGDDRGNHDV